MSRLRPLAPGVLHVLLFTALAFLLTPLLAPVGVGVTAVAVLLGVVAGNLLPPGPLLRPGVQWAAKRLLTAAVVLLGLRVTAHDVLGLGATAAFVVLGVVALVPLLALALGRFFGVAAPLAACLGAGTAICGVSAIAAVQRAVGAREEDVSYAVATVTVLGSVGLLLYPVVQWAWHPFDAAAYGLLAGATLHSVPQAVGAGFAGGGIAAGAVATVVKLGRVALLGPMVVVLGLFLARGRGGRMQGLPPEVWGFLALFAFGSLVALPRPFLAAVAVLDELLLVAALVGLGLLTSFSGLRQTGLRPLFVALLAWVAALALALGVLAAT